MLGQKVTPLKRVGVYVPGGKAGLSFLCSHEYRPCQSGGVDQIIMTTPPERWQSLPHHAGGSQRGGRGQGL